MTDRHFHSLKLHKKIMQTDLACTLELEVPEELKDTYKFRAGQYLTFKTLVAGEELRRSYSINSASCNNEPLQVTVKQVTAGRVSKHFLYRLKEGDMLEVMPPLGQFVLPETMPEKNYFYAAGSGITPIIGLIKTILYASDEATVNLQYGNFEQAQVIFYDELESLRTQFPSRFTLLHHYTNAEKTDSGKGLFGKLFSRKSAENKLQKYSAGDFTSEKLIALAKSDTGFKSAHHFICGPGQMIPELEATLLALGVQSSNIHHEYFAAADAASTASKNEIPVVNNTEDVKELLTSLTVTLDGETQTFALPAGETVLRASIEEGLSVPYACESGVCATCKARCTKGKVKLRSNAVLSENELADGFILTCQAEALSEEVHVDYDDV